MFAQKKDKNAKLEVQDLFCKAIQLSWQSVWKKCLYAYNCHVRNKNINYPHIAGNEENSKTINLNNNHQQRR